MSTDLQTLFGDSRFLQELRLGSEGAIQEIRGRIPEAFAIIFDLHGLPTVQENCVKALSCHIEDDEVNQAIITELKKFMLCELLRNTRMSGFFARIAGSLVRRGQRIDDIASFLADNLCNLSYVELLAEVIRLSKSDMSSGMFEEILGKTEDKYFALSLIEKCMGECSELLGGFYILSELLDIALHERNCNGVIALKIVSHVANVIEDPAVTDVIESYQHRFDIGVDDLRLPFLMKLYPRKLAVKHIEDFIMCKTTTCRRI